MKKFVLSAMAGCALVVGGVAHADVIDSVGNTISRIFGVPYDARPSAPVPLGQYGSYRDQWGRTVYLDANHQPAYVAQNGQLVPYGSVAGNYALAPSYDQDGDGVPNGYDRFPQDPRYR